MGLVDTGYTKVLHHFLGTDGQTSCIDESAKSWTFSGDAQIDTSQYKFGGSSLLCDGTTDAIATTDKDDLYLFEDFTIDLWVRFADLGTSKVHMFSAQYQDANNYHDFYWYGGTNQIFFNVLSGAVTIISVAQSWSPSINTWYHIEFCRSGNDFFTFVDGTQLGTEVTDSSAIPNFTGNFYIGGWINANQSTNGWIDEFRLLNGIAAHTSNFTPETSPYIPTIEADDAYTKSLMSFDGTTGTRNMLDKCGKCWATYGNAVISQAAYKFGTASLLSDGTNDGLYLSSTTVDQDFAFGSDDFTIEFYFYYVSLTGAGDILYDGRPAVNGLYPSLGINVSGQIYYYTDSAIKITGTTSLATSTWHHLELSRSGTSTKLFINGTQEGSTYTDSNVYINGANRPFILNGYDGSYSTNGRIDEFRISKGIARHTSNFTPESSAYAPKTWGAYGGNVSEDGDYVVLEFKQSQTCIVNDAVLPSSYLVIAGGGGGGSNSSTVGGGGGGAGGYRESATSLSQGIVKVIVGSGGASDATGQDSILDDIVSAGGGSGGSGEAGEDGGSGGGASGNGAVGGAGGTATPVGQGNDGYQSVGTYVGGGGGGAGVAATSSNGGNGQASSITGTSVTRAGGGGGGSSNGIGGQGTGGTGGGGAGSEGYIGTAGTANTGGGGGGGGYVPVQYSAGGAGGSGIVIIRYLNVISSILRPIWFM